MTEFPEGFPRNPWRGISVWKEFKYDLRHPILGFRRAMFGAKGQNPLITAEERWVGIACVIMGLAFLILGLVTIGLAYL